MSVLHQDRATNASALATASAALGVGVVAVGLLRPPLAVGVVLGTAGIVAAALGLAALRLRADRRILPVVGVVSGAVSALVLVVALGLTLIDRPAPAAEPVASPTAAALPARSELTSVVSTLAYLLSQSRDADGGWPASVAVTPDGRVWATSGPNVGHVLLRTPDGTRLDYAVTDDQRRMVLTLTATGDPAATVRYSSASGLSTNE